MRMRIRKLSQSELLITLVYTEYMHMLISFDTTYHLVCQSSINSVDESKLV